jgi:alanyl-tRNA synthetase
MEEAKKEGAIALFGEKYEETVRTVKIGEFSHELCGGTHLHNTGEIGVLKILSETAIASGVRRIEAITGPYVEEYYKKMGKEVQFITAQLGVPANQVNDKINRLLDENKRLNKQMESYEKEVANKQLDDILNNIESINGIQLAIGMINTKDNNSLRGLGDNMRDRLKSGIGILGSVIDDKASLLVVVSKDLVNRFKAGDLASKMASVVNGKGGGRPDMAMAGGKDFDKIKAAFEEVKANIRQVLVSNEREE